MWLLVMVIWLFFSGCAALKTYGERSSIENERRHAVNNLIQAQANLISGCAGRVPKVCVWPSSWPVSVLVSKKEGEAETTFIKLPALPELLIP